MVQGPKLQLRIVSLATKTWGAENTLLTLLESIAKLDLQISIELAAPKGQLLDRFEKSKLGTIRILPTKFSSALSKLGLLKLQLELAGYLRSLPPADITHSHHQWTNLPVSLLLGSSQTVLDLHDFVRTRPGRLIQAAAVSLSGSVFVASETVRGQLPGAIRKKAVSLNRPIRLESSDDFNPRGQVSALTIAIVARPDPNKEIGIALEALRTALSFDDRVLVAGGELEEYGLDEIFGHDSRFQFLGHLANSSMKDLWRKANVHMLTSTREPFGRVVVEGASFGLPSIVHSGAGVASAVAQHGAGVVIESWDELGQALADLREPGVRIGTHAQLLALLEACDPDAVARKYVEKVFLGTFLEKNGA